MDAGIHKLVSLCHHAIVITISWPLDQCFFIGIILCNRLEITPSAYIKKHHKSTIQSNYEWKEWGTWPWEGDSIYIWCEQYKHTESWWRKPPNKQPVSCACDKKVIPVAFIVLLSHCFGEQKVECVEPNIDSTHIIQALALDSWDFAHFPRYQCHS